MRGTAAHRSGLTLVEVMVAVSILAFGVLGAASLQATALRASTTAEAVRGLATNGSGELAIARGRTFDHTEPATVGCVKVQDDCSIAIHPCRPDGTGALDCRTSPIAEPVAHALTITLTAGERSLSLRTVVRR